MFEGVRKLFFEVVTLLLLFTITMYVKVLFKNKLTQT